MDEVSFCDFLVDEMAKKIAELGADNIAAFFAEPILGSGGVIVPPEGYNRRTWELCRENDIIYVADEVVTGFGRLGHWFRPVQRRQQLPGRCQHQPERRHHADLRFDHRPLF